MFLAVFTICALLSSTGGTSTGIVAFSASVDGTRTIEAGQMLKFTKIHTNFGNAYNPDTGVFTASKTGVYVFSMNFVANFGAVVCFRLFHNDEPIVSACAREPSSHASVGNSVVLRVKSGHTVYVKAAQNSYLYDNEDHNYSTFTGYLIDRNVTTQ